MKKNLLLAAFFLSATLSTAQNVETRSKFNPDLSLLMNRYRHAATSDQRVVRAVGASAKKNDLERVKLIIEAENSRLISERLTAAGFANAVITEHTLTTELPATFVDSLAAMPEVRHIALSKRLKRNMDKARDISGVDKVHKGTELETPFTGKGVILGVIDQGFEYRHPAFNDKNGKSRVRSVWEVSDSLKKPTDVLPLIGEKTKSSHATHVTGIAAGMAVNNNNLQGVAPEAEIIMIPSELTEDEVLKGVSYIKEFADKEKKPWVVNMSFGSQLGPHDGTQLYDKTLDGFTGKGAFLVAAIGNEEQDKIHTMGTIKKGDVRYVIFEEPVADRDEAKIIFTLWNQTADGKEHLKITPVLLANDEYLEPDANFWKEAMTNEKATFWNEVASENKKQTFMGYFPCKEFEEFFAAKYPQHAPDQYFEVLPALKIELNDDETEPQTFHIWLADDKYGTVSSLATFEGKEQEMLRPVDGYRVGEGAACVPSAIAVGSYNSRPRWYSTFHKESMGGTNRVGKINEISKFSCSGPFLGKELKPAICAPGAFINSAFNKYDEELIDAQGDYVGERITRKETVNKEDFYYGMYEGTSMAAPFVSGVLCLWLQANPNLDYNTVMEIFRKTAIRDQYTGSEEWTPRRGYGKIDAYAGLKEALRMYDPNGIEAVANTEAPVSIQKGTDDWKILFNNPERQAVIRVYTTAGRMVETRRLQKVAQGHEEVLRLDALTPGAYLVNIATAGSNITRRVLVK